LGGHPLSTLFLLDDENNVLDVDEGGIGVKKKIYSLYKKKKSSSKGSVPSNKWIWKVFGLLAIRRTNYNVLVLAHNYHC
jgi:hypothetical protein